MTKILFLLNGIKEISEYHETLLKMAQSCEAEIVALYIFDEGYKDMLGDEWISTSEIRMNFYRYYESLLKNEAKNLLDDFVLKAKENNVSVEPRIIVGDPLSVLNGMLSSFAVAVMPNPKLAKQAEGGIKFSADKLLKQARCPVIFLS